MDPESAQLIEEAIRQAAEPHWLWRVYVGSNVTLALIAIGALVFAIRQFGVTRRQTGISRIQAEAAQAQVHAAKAQAAAAAEMIAQERFNTLRELDRDYESQQFGPAREEMHKFREDIVMKLEADSSFTGLADDGKKIIFLNTCFNELQILRSSEDREDKTRYRLIVRMADFFETMGLAVEIERVDFDQIYELYGGTILRVHDVLGDHIKNRQDDPDMPPGLYKYYWRLVERVNKQYEETGQV